MTYIGGYHVKADVLSFPKMWQFLRFGGFKPQLWAVKVGSMFEKKLDGKGEFFRPKTVKIFDYSSGRYLSKTFYIPSTFDDYYTPNASQMRDFWSFSNNVKNLAKKQASF